MSFKFSLAEIGQIWRKAAFLAVIAASLLGYLQTVPLTIDDATFRIAISVPLSFVY